MVIVNIQRPCHHLIRILRFGEMVTSGKAQHSRASSGAVKKQIVRDGPIREL